MGGVLVAICLLFSCSKSDPIDKEPCKNFRYNDLSLSIQEEFSRLPGKVSVFFKVDDKKGRGISTLEASNFTVYEMGRNDDCFRKISNNESFADINSKSQIFSYNTLLVLDFSGSVIGSSLQELKDASKSFIDNIIVEAGSESYHVGIWWFDGENKLHPLVDFESDKEKLHQAIDEITPNISSDPSTDLYGAVIKSSQLAHQRLNEFVEQDIIAASSVVIFTDGTDQAARYSKEQALGAIQNADPNIGFYTIGLGDEIDQDVLQAVGKTSHIFAADKEELQQKFSEAAAQVFSEANSYYLFEYCTPKRDGSGINELVIVADHDSGRGFLRTSFDATGFSSGCRGE